MGSSGSNQNAGGSADDGNSSGISLPNLDFGRLLFTGLTFSVAGVIIDGTQQIFSKKHSHSRRFRNAYGTLIPCLNSTDHETIAAALLDLVFCMTNDRCLEASEREKEKLRLSPPLPLLPPQADATWRSLCAKVGVVLGKQQSFLNDAARSQQRHGGGDDDDDDADDNGASRAAAMTRAEVTNLKQVQEDITILLEELEPYCFRAHSSIWTEAVDNLQTEIPFLLSTMYPAQFRC